MRYKHGIFRTTVLVGVITVFVIFYNILSKDNTPIIKTRIICFEDPEPENSTGLESVRIPVTINGNKTFTSCAKPSGLFSSPQSSLVETCVSNYEKDYKEWHDKFWTGDTQYIRHSYHKYLNSESIIVDVGGNVGDDAASFIDSYQPKVYVLLEPLKYLHRKLLRRFKDNRNVIVYNMGLGFKYEKFWLNIEGNHGDATSAFSKGEDGTCSLKIVNSTKFFVQLGLACFHIDLLTINCEGCEFAVVENLISTNQIMFIKHLQFATHTKIDRIKNPVFRYCRLQQMLKMTHTLGYQYKFIWETWVRNDIAVSV